MPELVYFDMVNTPQGGWTNLTCQEWLFWPSLCYRVVAPEARRHETNLFERTVLGLVNAKVVAIDAQARYLGLDVRLIETIQAQLLEEGLLGSPTQVSEKGLDVLRSTVYRTEHLVTGYVFQDPYTGTLWDRFIEDPRYANVELSGTTITLVRGLTGRPFKTRAFVQHHPEQHPAPPSQADVCRAIRRFKRSCDRISAAFVDSALSDSAVADMHEELLSQDEFGFEAGDGASVTRVTFLDASPVQCFVTTCLYSRSRVLLPSTLLAADPFMPGASDRLLRQILDLADERRDSPLAGTLNRLLKRTCEAGVSEFRAQISALRLQAERRVEEQLGFENRELAVFEPLARMEQAFLEAELLESQGDDRMLAAIANGRTVLEVLFRTVAMDSRLIGIHRHFDLPSGERGADAVKKQLERAAGSLGLRLPLPTHLTSPKALESAYGRIRRLSSDQRRLDRAGLRDLFEICLLAALGQPDHPFARAVKQEPEFAHRTFSFADNVNSAAHGNLPDGVDPAWLRGELYALLHLVLMSEGSRNVELT